MSAQNNYQDIFTPQALARLMPTQRANDFFEALYGDAAEGAYDIELAFAGSQDGSLMFELLLRQRPGKCLACNLTYGLPQVFSRHPVINLKSLAAEVGSLLGTDGVPSWELGRTREVSAELHVIPLTIKLAG
jgi:hypothetical protein